MAATAGAALAAGGGTLHLFASSELALWLAALRAKGPPHPPTAAELEAQVVRTGEILGLRGESAFGPVEARPHL